MGKFSKKAQRHAKQSRQRTERMLKGAATKSGPVKISYLPGFEPPQPIDPATVTKFPFEATINGESYLVYRDMDDEIVFEWLEEDTPYSEPEVQDDPEWWDLYEQPSGEEYYRDQAKGA